jgi:hypothetical protein
MPVTAPPRIFTLPLVGGSMPPSTDRSVVLPLPEDLLEPPFAIPFSL